MNRNDLIKKMKLHKKKTIIIFITRHPAKNKSNYWHIKNLISIILCLTEYGNLSFFYPCVFQPKTYSNFFFYFLTIKIIWFFILVKIILLCFLICETNWTKVGCGKSKIPSLFVFFYFFVKLIRIRRISIILTFHSN